MHDTVAPEVRAENVGQLLHQNLGHLQGADDDAQIVGGHHAGQVRRQDLVLEHVAQQFGGRKVDHAQQGPQTLVAHRGAGRRAVHLVQHREQVLDELGGQAALLLQAGDASIAVRIRRPRGQVDVADTAGSVWAGTGRSRSTVQLVVQADSG